jgi:hypothetical protein
VSSFATAKAEKVSARRLFTTARALEEETAKTFYKFADGSVYSSLRIILNFGLLNGFIGRHTGYDRHNYGRW